MILSAWRSVPEPVASAGASDVMAAVDAGADDLSEVLAPHEVNAANNRQAAIICAFFMIFPSFPIVVQNIIRYKYYSTVILSHSTGIIELVKSTNDT